MMPAWFSLVIALPSSLLLTKLVIELAYRFGWVAKPKADRWHQKPTALYGGVAIFATVAFCLMTFDASFWTDGRYDLIGLLAGGAMIFAIGLIDDIRPLNPLLKLVGQVVSCTLFLAGMGIMHVPEYSLQFLLSLPLAILWMLGLTNAFNLLDNMDGLSAGTAAITGALLSVLMLLNGFPKIGLISALLSVSCLGFLFFNFRIKGSARIFMGDCGSMFLGYMLAGLSSIAAWKQAAWGWHAAAIPILIMALPIFDTTLVTILRKREGRSISQGGKDHSSHRLVYAGLSEKQAVLFLYGVSLLAGGAAFLIWKLHSNFVAAIVSLVALGAFFMGGAYLGRFTQVARPRLEILYGGNEGAGRTPVAEQRL